MAAVAAALLMSVRAGPEGAAPDRPDQVTRQAADRELARTILRDERMDAVLRMGQELLRSGMNAGSGYSEVWIRDLNTFIVPLLDVAPRQSVREALLVFFHFQGEDGNIVDGYVPKKKGHVGYKYRFAATSPELKAHKNTVETDQESSLVQAVCRYVRKTKDTAILDELVRDIPVRERLEMALEYPLKHRYSEKHGLIWGATTADWGDVQPEHEWGVELDENSHRAIDIYDNALFLVAIGEYLEAVCAGDAARNNKWTIRQESLRKSVREHLWDEAAQKLIPHIYLEGSPFPEELDENKIFYHGGTAVAIEAGLLTRDEIAESHRRMRENMGHAGAATIGLTMYPPYPKGLFKNGGMGPYSYQNGGDWTWFGARMVRQLARNGYAGESYRELAPMLERVLKHDGFFEWWTPGNEPRGSGKFRGSAGVLIEAIHELREWARDQPEKRPNIIYIYTDQQSASMMSCTGNKDLKTPAMDYIAGNGIRFARAYTPNPVCVPARVGLMTGRFPGYFSGANEKPPRNNGQCSGIRNIPDEVKSTTIAAYLKQAGYDLVYGGKVHLPPELNPQALGFRILSGDQRKPLAQAAAGEIAKDHSRPFFMIVSLINPHDICYMAIRDARKGAKGPANEMKALNEAMTIPDGVTEDEFYDKLCPPLPRNMEPQRGEPEAIRALVEQRGFRKHARDHYSDRQWKMHRYAYCRLTERVDSEIQIILDALKAGGREEDTLVMFSSDHGDMDAAHRMEHKTALYEEAANIPFMAMWKGKIPAGRVDGAHLISNGLDLLPTVCDYAGIDGVADPRGRSLRPLFEGKPVEWRKTLGVESEIGRMVVSADRFKYIKYDMGKVEEQLLNLNEDPDETTHFTNDLRFAERLKQLKAAYQEEWFPGL